MTKKLSLFLTLLLCFGLSTGCGEAETAGSPANTVPDGSFSADDIALILEGHTFRCDTDVQDAIALLGDGYSYSEAISCAYDGMDKIFSYEKVDLYTYPKGEQDYLLEVTSSDADASTPKGINVGDPSAAVVAAYGEGYEMRGILMTYELPAPSEDTAGASLYFTIEDDFVTSIGITAEQVLAE